MEILEPELSHHRNYKALGKKLNREDALRSPVLSEIFEVADFFVENDPVVNRYSETGDTGYSRRELKVLDTAQKDLGRCFSSAW